MIVLLSFCWFTFLAVLNASEKLPYDDDKPESGGLTTQTIIDTNMNEIYNDQMNNTESEEILEDLAHLDPVIENVSSTHTKPAINPFFIFNKKKKIPLYFLYKFNQHVLRPLQEKWQEFHSFLAYPFNQNIGGLCLLNPPPVSGSSKGRIFLLHGAHNSITGLTQPPPLCPFYYDNTKQYEPVNNRH